MLKRLESLIQVRFSFLLLSCFLLLLSLVLLFLLLCLVHTFVDFQSTMNFDYCNGTSMGWKLNWFYIRICFGSLKFRFVIESEMSLGKKHFTFTEYH